MTGKKPDAPADLGAEAQKLWDEVTGAYQLRPDEHRLLEDACREVDLIEQLRAGLPKDRRKWLIRGSMGQQVAHPYIGELRQHRATLAAMLKQLKLTDLVGKTDQTGASDDTPTASDTSTSARNAAIARWGRRGG